MTSNLPLGDADLFDFLERRYSFYNTVVLEGFSDSHAECVAVSALVDRLGLI